MIVSVISLTHGGKQVCSFRNILLILKSQVYNKFILCTELGGIAIAPHPQLTLQELKPGFIMKPSFGVIPRLIDDDVIIRPYLININLC